jgi:hypothetical protein
MGETLQPVAASFSPSRQGGRRVAPVLRVGARVLRSGPGRARTLSSSAAPFWALLWPRIARMHWAGP